MEEFGRINDRGRVFYRFKTLDFNLPADRRPTGNDILKRQVEQLKIFKLLQLSKIAMATSSAWWGWKSSPGVPEMFQNKDLWSNLLILLHVKESGWLIASFQRCQEGVSENFFWADWALLYNFSERPFWAGEDWASSKFNPPENLIRFDGKCTKYDAKIAFYFPGNKQT